MNAPTRTTRECSLDALAPEIVAAIRQHLGLYKIGDIESSILICCETTSVEKKTGFFGSGKETTSTATLLTPELLVVAERKGNEAPTVFSGELKNIEVQDFEDTAMFKIKPDTGVNVTGRYSDVTKHGMIFIGLGPEPAAQKFRHALIEAARKKWR